MYSRVAALRVLAEDLVVAAQVVVAAEARRAAPHDRPGLHDDLRADRPRRARAERVDLAGDVGAEAVRVLELERGAAAADPDVEVIERDGADADAHLAGPGSGIGQLLEAEHLGAAVLAQHHRGHRHDRGYNVDSAHARHRRFPASRTTTRTS